MSIRPQEGVRASAISEVHDRTSAFIRCPGYSSPLLGLHDGDEQLLEQAVDGVATLREVRGVRLANLRVDPTDPALAEDIGSALGFELPRLPSSVTQERDLAVLWLAPREWLLRSAGPDAASVVARIESVLSGRFFAVNEQSDAFAVMQLHGPKARAVLNSGCPLDLHPRVFKRDQCAQSHFFKSSVLLWALSDDGTAWEIIVRRSFSDYVARMLLDAMAGVV